MSLIISSKNEFLSLTVLSLPAGMVMQPAVYDPTAG